MIPDLNEADRKRLAAAYRDRQRAAPRRAAPTMQAPSPEACRKCGVPGSKGCEHYLPLAPRSVNTIQGRR